MTARTSPDNVLLTGAQLKSEIEKCEYCAEKPCTTACPCDCSPFDFIMAARVGNPHDFRRAAALIFSKNPLGGICGMVCPDWHCMKACVHARFDSPVDIPAIQATVIQRARELGVMPKFVSPRPNGTRVAVVGAGPALRQGFDAVVVATGLWAPVRMGIPHEDRGIVGIDYLKSPRSHRLKGRVAVIGGGASALDCAVTAKRLGARSVEMFALEDAGEMPLTARERRELIEAGITVSGRTRVTGIAVKGKRITGLGTIRVQLPPGKKFSLKMIRDARGTAIERGDIDYVIIAIGARSELTPVPNKAIFYAGDIVTGPSTVVEAAAAGKNAAALADAFLSGAKKPNIDKPTKSTVAVPGYNFEPVPLTTDFFGRTISSPFLLSASPASDGFDQVKAGYEAGWPGAIMKTAFDNLPIHIPGEYMNCFNETTWGNCDNVSDHPLDRVCAEIKKLVRLYPDRLTGASTGGSVSGNDEVDRGSWQGNTRKLESAGAMVIEYSLSCPQGGEGAEGDIVSQNAALTAKIIDWVMEVSDPAIPKLFKLTSAVTDIRSILGAVARVFAKYPHKK
ncbi:MAG: FAD-dependent oxidoreductase, partial [Candidatus Aureabacteria bacterium]|nr:FAD-dependent oxidoreductase [Candidatus Auribacterota bacterium]